MKRKRDAALDPAAAIAMLMLKTDPFGPNFGRPLFPPGAKQLWPAYRREVWLRTQRMHVPRAAMVFDLVWLEAPDVVRFTYQHIDLPLDRVHAALAADRARLADFAADDPRAALAIADVLAIVHSDLALIERQAAQLARLPCTLRQYPPHTWPLRLYSGEAWPGMPEGA
jgi:hypothetical protein